MINESKSSDKKLHRNSFCEYLSTIARNLKSKSILLRDLCLEQTFLIKIRKVSLVSGMDNFPPGLLKDAALVLTKPLTFYDVKALC